MYTFFSTIYFVLPNPSDNVEYEWQLSTETGEFQTVGNDASSKDWKLLFTKENTDTKNEMLRKEYTVYN